MVLATVLFACMGVCVKLASQHFGTAAVVSARGLVAVSYTHLTLPTNREV